MNSTLKTRSFPLWQRLVALITIFAPAHYSGAQTITNPSFEADTFTVDPGTVWANSAITGWTGPDITKYGLNPAATSSIANNGAIPNGTKVAFILGGGSMSTTITGLTTNTVYKVSFRTNATYDAVAHNPIIRVSTDGIGVAVDYRASASGTTATTSPYKYFDYEFKATAASQVLTVANLSADNNTVLLDDFSIAVSGGKWAFRQVTGDADTGIDSQYYYSHAYTFGGATAAVPTTVNGVTFAPIQGGNPQFPGKLAITGLPNGFGDAARSVGGSANLLVKSFIYGGPVMTITIRGLKPNTPYRSTIYGVAFDIKPYGRASTFSGSPDPANRLTVDLDQYDQTNGIALDYAYTTDALGSPVVITYTMGGDSSFHTSAFANRETTPSVAPVSNWTAAAWADNATSGVDNSFIYTHAYSFGSAASTNINGVAFTGAPGANPTVAGKFVATGLGNVFNNDANNVNEAGSRTLANDFLYNGFPATLTLSGLTAGKAYVYTLYSMGWEGPGARQAFFSQPDTTSYGVLIDQDQFGDNNGIRFECRYTAGASGTAIFAALPIQNASIHHYGFSNREAVAVVAPTISTQPTGGTVAPGDSFTFTVGVSGSSPLTYVWKHGTTVVGTNSPLLELTGITDADKGSYTVTVSNASGTKTSDPATLNVFPLIPGFFDTGVGDDHFALPDNSTDPHYLLLVNPDGNSLDPTIVEDSTVFPIVTGPWVPNTGTTKWIGPKFNTSASAGEGVDAGAGPGVYVYRTTVDLTGYDLNTAVITGSWATDNFGVDIKVNDGVVANPSTGLTNTAQFVSMTPFTIKNGPGAPGAIGTATFVNGINTIDFYVQNATVAVGYTGLNVAGIRGLGNPVAAGVLQFVPPYLAGGAHFRFQGAAGTAYHLDRSANLSTWSTIDTKTAPANGTIDFLDATPPPGRNYYRVSQ